ncbi:hypothetical protein L198_02541 [Cryptococcus wingfieldii CBS 7118]|uniref:SET domain-containing protein n=1 Tax=Cryptococcus wingfieldii CBS 7118 TaxID=1295528 RepID=A0A1E3JLS5_9TREE|nr:hypothetical protein L198_02541 [Cryptococcus wingfieldii CBS 7118]ODO01814.1 hypothetical protein L198_02541 [Cryptococcus wingfieldii CBS 7118]
MSPLFSIQPIPGKGRGLIANQHIPRGTLLISDEPLLTFRPATKDGRARAIELYQQLPYDKKIAVEAFREGHGRMSLRQVLLVVGLPIEQQGGRAGVFENASLLNHSCIPNCYHCWDGVKGQEIVHALIDIPAGAELTIDYTSDDSLLFYQRQGELQRRFHFTCSCPLCSLPRRERKKSANRRHRYTQLVDDFLTALTDSSPKVAMGLPKTLFKLIEKESLWSHLGARYADGFQLCAMHSDVFRAHAWARRAKQAYTIARGTDSKDAKGMALLEKVPERFGLFGTLCKIKMYPPGALFVPSSAKQAFANGVPSSSITSPIASLAPPAVSHQTIPPAAKLSKGQRKRARARAAKEATTATILTTFTSNPFTPLFLSSSPSTTGESSNESDDEEEDVIIELDAATAVHHQEDDGQEEEESRFTETEMAEMEDLCRMIMEVSIAESVWEVKDEMMGLGGLLGEWDW